MRASGSTEITKGSLALILTISVFVLDCLTPLGYAVPILYLIPLTLVGQQHWKTGIFWFAGAATMLAMIGYFTGPDGGISAPALFNRAASVIVLWGTAYVLSSEKRTEWKLCQQADLNRAILDTVAAHITLIDGNGQAMELGSGSNAHGSIHESHFMEALQSARWQDVMRHSYPSDPTDPDDYLPGVWDVVQGRRAVYSTEYGRVTSSGFRWFLLYAKMLGSREGAVVAHIDMTERREAQEALQEREREIQLLLDAREALAQDLHDEVIQRLYALGLKLSTWRRRTGEAGSPVASRFGEVIFDIDQVIRQVRGYLDGGTQAQVEGKDLSHHVQQLMCSMVKDTCVQSTLSVDSTTASQLNAKQVAHLLAMIREAVSNALQHAAANHVSVALLKDSEQVVLTVEDDGHGFNTAHAADGRGLANLRRRAARMGGQARIVSAPGQGTSIQVEFPLEVSCDVH